LKIEDSILPAGTGNSFRQYFVNFIQKIAMIGTLGEGFLPDTFFAGALNQVSDFEIVFEFEIFFLALYSRIYFFLSLTEGSNFELIF
jgi:hypothetical protein